MVHLLDVTREAEIAGERGTLPGLGQMATGACAGQMHLVVVSLDLGGHVARRALSIVAVVVLVTRIAPRGHRKSDRSRVAIPALHARMAVVIEREGSRPSFVPYGEGHVPLDRAIPP